MPDVSGLAKARRAFGQSIPDPVALDQSLENLPPANAPSAPTFASALVHDALLATEALDAATALAESLALQAGTRSMGEYAQLGGAAAVPHAELLRWEQSKRCGEKLRALHEALKTRADEARRAEYDVRRAAEARQHAEALLEAHERELVLLRRWRDEDATALRVQVRSLATPSPPSRIRSRLTAAHHRSSPRSCASRTPPSSPNARPTRSSSAK